MNHLEVMTAVDIESFEKYETMPVALPSYPTFSVFPYTPAREMVPLDFLARLRSTTQALHLLGMNFVVATACIKMKIGPEEAINATVWCLCSKFQIHGSITVGKKKQILSSQNIFFILSTTIFFW
jgi:imidazolonepropionase